MIKDDELNNPDNQEIAAHSNSSLNDQKNIKYDKNNKEKPIKFYGAHTNKSITPVIAVLRNEFILLSYGFFRIYYTPILYSQINHVEIGKQIFFGGTITITLNSGEVLSSIYTWTYSQAEEARQFLEAKINTLKDKNMSSPVKAKEPPEDVELFAHTKTNMKVVSILLAFILFCFILILLISKNSS